MTWRAGAAALARAILGAGLILMPPVAFAVAGAAAGAAWLAHLVAGASVSAAIGLLASGHTGAGDIAEVSGRALGRWARQAVYGCYLAGFTVGQAAIVTAAARLFSAGVAGRTQRPLAELAAVAAVAVALAASGAGALFSPAMRACRLAVTAVIALLVCTWPSVPRSAQLLSAPSALTAGSAVFLLFFAGVGWEATARIGPSLPGRRALLRAVLAAAVVVGASYGGLILLLAARAGAAGPPVTVRLLAGVGAYGVLLLYCAGNTGTAVAFTSALTGRAVPGARLVIAAASGALAVAAIASGTSIAALLLIPCGAAWAGYLIAATAATRVGAVRRPAGIALIFLLLGVAAAAMA